MPQAISATPSIPVMLVVVVSCLLVACIALIAGSAVSATATRVTRRVTTEALETRGIVTVPVEQVVQEGRVDVALRRQILGVVPGKTVRFECGVVSGRTEVRGVGGRRTSSYGTETLTLRTRTGEEWSSSSASGLLGSPPGEVAERLRAFVADGSETALTLWWAPWLENIVGIPFALVAALALLALLRVAFGKATA